MSTPSVGSCPHHDRLLEQHLLFVEQQTEQIGAAFYERLFSRHPEMKALFGQNAGPAQQLMVLYILSMVAHSLDDDASWIIGDLRTVAANHVDYEVQPGMYAQAAVCFVEAVGEVTGDDWSPDLHMAWRDRLAWLNRTLTGEPEPAPASPSEESSFEGTDMLALDTHTFDPEPLYEWLREQRPLYWDPINELWAVSRYDDVVFVSRRTDLFCSGFGVVPNVGTDVWPDEAMINLDGDEHTHQRGIINKGFTSRRIDALEPRIRAVANEMIDRVIAKGSCDLVLDLARPLPFRIISGMLGYATDENYEILDWTDAYSMGGCGPEHVTDEVVEAFSSFVDYHDDLLEEKKRCPGAGLLNLWMDAELDGKKLSEDKLLYEHNLLLVGGSETTRTAIAAGIQALMAHPEQLAWLREHVDDAAVLSTAVEEMIRYSCPFVRMRRTATQDVELHGQVIEEGQQIIMLYPAANRDPRAFQDPQAFDVRRRNRLPSMSFGVGKHFCIGSSLARLETRIVLEVVLRRLQDLRLDPSAEPVPARSSFVRSLTHLPVVFTPASP